MVKPEKGYQINKGKSTVNMGVGTNFVQVVLLVRVDNFRSRSESARTKTSKGS